MALRRVRHPASSDANQGAGMWLRGRRPLRGRPCRSHPARSGRGARRRLRRYQIRFRGYGDGAPATTATPSATDSGGRGAYGGRPTTSGAGTPASGTAVAIDNFAFSPATLKAKGGPAGHLDQQAGRRAHRDRQRGRVQPSHAVGGRRSRSPSPRRAPSRTTARSTRRCRRRSWCRSDLGLIRVPKRKVVER
jgi:hypothetical protein